MLCVCMAATGISTATVATLTPNLLSLLSTGELGDAILQAELLTVVGNSANELDNSVAAALALALGEPIVSNDTMLTTAGLNTCVVFLFSLSLPSVSLLLLFYFLELVVVLAEFFAGSFSLMHSGLFSSLCM